MDLVICSGYLITATSKEGYGGDVQISVGISADGTLTGIGFLSLNETAGLGMNADTPDLRISLWKTHGRYI